MVLWTQLLPVTTTIHLTPETRERLAALRSTPRETYDELLNKLLDLVPEGDEEGRYSDAFRAGLVRARLDVRAGRLTNSDQIKRRLEL